MVRALTEGLRREIKGLNNHIRIASVSPGLVETQFFETYLKDNAALKPEDLFKRNPLQSKDVADSVVHILSAPQHVEIHDIIVCPYSG
ncbi:hypothetical protein AVEN_254752-1 [Araneus ventricosus]|uniref:Dehydrogenase/reductase SDR family member 11 n=1 Tax=Araneus ventricosus TaxID=182803 RepID=A0A4Y2TXL2_ARAVE|nr:hypothetical protein AVEN_254752-1 [Araneus ventricosus]